MYLLLLITHAAQANDAISIAARIGGVERDVVENIIRVESGARPFVINTNSELGSFYFQSRGSAEQALALLLKKGYKNLDIGAAQVNIRWHPDLYEHPAELFDVRKNIIAAGYVLKKHRKPGDTLFITVGRYHSPSNTERANQYAAKVLKKNLKN